MSIASPRPGARYAFADDPTGPDAVHHGELVAILGQILDPFTIGRLTPLVTGSARCLEVAAGAGTIATWLADHAGQVTATDLDTRHMPDRPDLTVIRHDLTTDPLPAAAYDLIHARLVLAHLPQRREVVDRLVAALAPGGWLLLEEFQAAWDWCVLDAPDLAEATRLFTAYHHALTAVLAAAGNDTGWSRRLHRVMRQAGLVEVQTELWTRSWDGGQPGARLPYTAAAQLRPKLVAAGMTPDDIEALRELLRDPRLVIHTNLAVSTRGRRP